MAREVERYRRCAAAVVLGAMGIVLAVRIVRPHAGNLSAPLRFLIGTLPNAAAAIGLPFLAVSVRRPDRERSAPRAVTLGGFAAAAALVFAVLSVWELVQFGVWRIRFDPFDVAATGVGALAAIVVHWVVCRRPALSTEHGRQEHSRRR